MALRLKNYADYIEQRGIVRLFLLVFVFLQPFKFFNSVRHTAFVMMLLFLAARAAAGRVRLDFRDGTVKAFTLLVLVSLLSSALSPYPLDSFDAFRKNLFYQAAVFIVILNEYRGAGDLRPLIYSILGGFAALTAAILIQKDPGVLFNWLEHTNREDPLLLGYSLFATFYIPLGLAYLYSGGERRAVRWSIAAFLAIEFVLSLLNNHRTQVAAFGLSAVAVTVMAGRYKTLVVIAALAAASAFALVKLKPDSFDRYKTLASYQTYVSNEHRALNNRLAIWTGAIDMIKERPLLGWGYGWKKISTVAKDRFLERWKDEPERRETRAYYAETGYGGANPHNLFLQMLFETGALGLVAFLFLWASVAAKGLFLRGRNGGGALFLRYSVAGVLISYLVINMTNGLWHEAYGVLMAAFAAIICVLYRSERAGADA